MSLSKRISYEEEKRKNPELKDSDVEILKDWCAKQPHLPKISDSEYALFLHSNYYRLESTKNTIEEYYTIRSHVPEFFCNRDPLKTKQLREAFEVMAHITLSMNTEEDYKMIYVRLKDYEVSKFSYTDNVKYFFMMMDLWLHTEGSAKGHLIIIDMEGFTLAHIGCFNPLIVKKALHYLQEAIPIRLKGLHFANSNAVLDKLMTLIKSFIKKELMELIHTHSTKDTLEKCIPLEALPSDLGGKSAPLLEQQEEQIKKLVDYRKWFLQDEVTGRVNEAKRMNKSKTVTDLSDGIEGSFKKLDVD